MTDYLITTTVGSIPNIIRNEELESLNKGLIFYADDFIYKDSPYEKLEMPLREFCNVPKNRKIFLLCRNKFRIFESKRGRYKITAEEYEGFVRRMQPDYCSDTLDVIDPQTFEEFLSVVDKKVEWVGTSFLNNLVEKGKMLKFNQDGVLEVGDIYNCRDGDCCSLSNGYLEYLYSINEINAFYYLAVHNYNMLNKFFKEK